MGIARALVLTAAMALAILFCRAFPFLFFRGKSREQAGPLLDIVEKVVPPAAMTVLAFNAVGASLREDIHGIAPVLIASIFTALVHLWRRNALLSIIGGTALFMALKRI